jgi:hypothetical protein
MKKPAVKYRFLAISILVSALIIVVTGLAVETVSPQAVVFRLFFPLLRLMAFITLGLLAGQTVEFLGWTRQFAIVARPLFGFSRLGNHCSAAFTTAFFSGAAANAMLYEFYETGKISKARLFLSNYMNHFPAFFLHLPTTMFIVLPLTGKAGAIYFLLTFLATLFRVLVCLCIGKLFLGPPSAASPDTLPESVDTSCQPFSLKCSHLLKKIRRSLPRRILNILVWVLPIYSLVFALTETGLFKTINAGVSSHIALEFMPVESLSVVILSFAAEFTSGFAAAGALLNAGVLTVKQTVEALLLGNIIAFPVRALRHQLPRYLGIFSPKLGLQILLSGQFFRITSLVFIGIIYYWVG